MILDRRLDRPFQSSRSNSHVSGIAWADKVLASRQVSRLFADVLGNPASMKRLLSPHGEKINASYVPAWVR